MFELNRTQREIQKAAGDFANGEFDKDLAYKLEKNLSFPEKIWKKSADLGFLGIHFPENCSGGGLGLVEQVLIAEEWCKKDSTMGCALTLAGYGAECLLHFGSDAQKKAWLPPIAEGKALSSLAFNEDGKGFNLSSMEATARQKEDQWIINGKKHYVLYGGADTTFIVLCQTAESKDEKDISMILVESDAPGLRMESMGRRLGCNMTPLVKLSLENVKVSAGNFIGKPGEGISQYQTFLTDYWIILAGMALGNAQGAFERATDYVKERIQFNRQIAKFQVIQHQVADMATKIELARFMVYQAADARDQGKSDRKLSAMAKMAAARTAVEVCGQTIQLFGGYGFMVEYEVERYYRDAKTIDLLAGGDRIQRDVIADCVIGKLKEI